MPRKDELRIYLEQKLEEHKQHSPEDNKSLLGALMHWGSGIPCTTLYEGIKSQIEYQAERYNIPPKMFIDQLFKQDNYDSWMLLFQS